MTCQALIATEILPVGIQRLFGRLLGMIDDPDINRHLL